MGADIVAEGIENKEQLEVLASLHCTKAQGYLISRPIAVSDVPNMVEQLQNPDIWRSVISD